MVESQSEKIMEKDGNRIFHGRDLRKSDVIDFILSLYSSRNSLAAESDKNPSHPTLLVRISLVCQLAPLVTFNSLRSHIGSPDFTRDTTSDCWLTLFTD